MDGDSVIRLFGEAVVKGELIKEKGERRKEKRLND